VLLEDAQHAAPVVGDVTGGPPAVADRLRPVPRLVLAPLADGEHDRPAGGGQRVPHPGVPLLRGAALVVAVVVLQVVHAPVGGRLRVHLLVVQRAGHGVRAGPGAGAGVDAELQATGVHVVGERLDPAGERGRVGGEPAARVPVLGRPAVVDVDVLVAG